MKALVVLSPLYSSLLSYTLRKMNYDVDELPDGKVGLSLLRDNHYQLIVTAYILPYYNGLYLLKYLSDANVAATSPITIMISRVHSPEIIHNGYTLGLTRFISALKMDVEAFITYLASVSP